MIELMSLLNSMNKDEHFDMDSQTTAYIWTILSFLIAFITAYIAYQCNRKENLLARLLISLFAFTFSGIYLIYYLFVYIILGRKCHGMDSGASKHKKHRKRSQSRSK